MELKRVKSEELIFREALLKSEGICKKLSKDLSERKMVERHGTLLSQTVNDQLKMLPEDVADEFCRFAKGTKRGLREFYVGIEKINDNIFRYYAKSFDGDLLAESNGRCGNQSDLIKSFEYEKRFFFSADALTKAKDALSDDEVLDLQLYYVVTEPVKLVTKIFQRLTGKGKGK